VPNKIRAPTGALILHKITNTVTFNQNITNGGIPDIRSQQTHVFTLCLKKEFNIAPIPAEKSKENNNLL